MALGYTTGGTVSVPNGGTTVNGTGTAWLTDVHVGATFEALGLQVTIEAVVSATELTLALPWPGTDLTDDANYLVRLDPVGSALGLLNNERVSELLDLVRITPAIRYTDGVPSAAVGRDEDTGIDLATRDMYRKEAGDWLPVWSGTIISQQIAQAVVLTRAEFNALPVKNPNTMYAIRRS